MLLCREFRNNNTTYSCESLEISNGKRETFPLLCNRDFHIPAVALGIPLFLSFINTLPSDPPDHNNCPFRLNGSDRNAVCAIPQLAKGLVAQSCKALHPLCLSMLPVQCAQPLSPGEQETSTGLLLQDQVRTRANPHSHLNFLKTVCI